MVDFMKFREMSRPKARHLMTDLKQQAELRVARPEASEPLRQARGELDGITRYTAVPR
jgi:hypothetical protein